MAIFAGFDVNGTIPAEGQRFSHVYLDSGDPIQDSPRMRVRMRSLVMTIDSLRTSTIVEDELGVEFRTWREFFDHAATRDVLDLVTVGYQHVAKQRFTANMHVAWLQGVQRIFEEENVHYRVDSRGGVHFYFDKEFGRATAAAIGILQSPRYANSLDAFNKGLSALAGAPPDGKAAIRGIFTASEGLFRLMFPDVERLASKATDRLRHLIQLSYPGDRPAQEAAEKMLLSFRGWIDAAQEYRHEEGRPDTIAQPPLTLAVYLVSCGAAHLRWLAELDAVTPK